MELRSAGRRHNTETRGAFPFQRPLLTTGAAVPQVPDRVQAGRSHNTSQETPNDGREGCDRVLSSAHTGSSNAT
jgi:hypothetical protein